MKELLYVWRKIPVTKAHIDIRTLLTCGQSFSWKETDENIWSNVINNVTFSLSQTSSDFLWCTPLRDQINEASNSESVHEKSGDDNLTDLNLKQNGCDVNDSKKEIGDEAIATKCKTSSHSGRITVREEDSTPSLSESHLSAPITDDQAKALLFDYFQFHVDLPSLYKQWSAADNNFEKVADSFLGIRIMRQNPTENLFSFICSSNNHVSRISGMVQKLAENYGTKRGHIGDQILYSFPEVDDLDKPGVEGKLRELGFGYRAKYIAATAKIIHRERPEGWLNSLRSLPYEECISELTKLQGVGRKVADCVALMSLDKNQVVPVDTHVLQIAARDYKIPGIGKNMKSLTPAIHDKIAKYFIDLYGDYAGWAHTVLFAADLKRFSDHSSVKSTKSAAKLSEPAAKAAKPDPKAATQNKSSAKAKTLRSGRARSGKKSTK